MDLESLELPHAWVWSTLGELSGKIGSGITPRGGQSNYTNDGVAFIRSQNVKMLELDLSDVQYISEQLDSEMSRTRVQYGDVLLNITGASIGRVTWFNRNDLRANVNQHVCIIRPLAPIHDWIALFLASTYGQKQIMEKQTGVTRQGLNYQQIANIRIPVPPLAEQRRIVQKIEESLIFWANSNKALENSEATLWNVRDSILEELIIQKFNQEPYIRSSVTLASEDRANNNQDSSKMTHRHNPISQPHWTTLESLLVDKNSLSYGILKPGEIDPDGIPMLRIMDIGEGKLNNTTIFKVSKSLSNQYARTVVHQGDLVIAIMGTIGRTMVVPKSLEGVNVNRALAVIKLSKNVDPQFVCYSLMAPSIKKELQKNTMGSAQQRINLSDLRKIMLPNPPKSIQQSISSKITETCKKLDEVERELLLCEKLNIALKQSILIQAFEGKLIPQDPDDEPAYALLERIRAGKKKGNSTVKVVQ